QAACIGVILRGKIGALRIEGVDGYGIGDFSPGFINLSIPFDPQIIEPTFFSDKIRGSSEGIYGIDACKSAAYSFGKRDRLHAIAYGDHRALNKILCQGGRVNGFEKSKRLSEDDHGGKSGLDQAFHDKPRLSLSEI